MPRVILFFSIIFSISGCFTTPSYGQYAEEAPRPFEVYGLASGMKPVDATSTVVVVNPGPNQAPGFAPNGLASGVRAGFVWRHENIGLVADLGFHKYSDRTGSTSLAPLIVGLRVYSDERYRTSFFGEGLAGAYRWTVNSGDLHFTTGKGIVLGGGGMDIRLTRRLVWRVFELQFGIAGARNGPLLTGGPSTGIAYRFGRR
ncbi:MAG TPA: hypothetical protein VJP02_06135 [Candidatus Sulfotelmatobacter sp.]|nr:hypothetical protein [Candidatus Sulfotelmatobacter sp.]